MDYNCRPKQWNGQIIELTQHYIDIMVIDALHHNFINPHPMLLVQSLYIFSSSPQPYYLSRLVRLYEGESVMSLPARKCLSAAILTLIISRHISSMKNSDAYGLPVQLWTWQTCSLRSSSCSYGPQWHHCQIPRQALVYLHVHYPAERAQNPSLNLLYKKKLKINLKINKL